MTGKFRFKLIILCVAKLSNSKLLLAFRALILTRVNSIFTHPDLFRGSLIICTAWVWPVFAQSDLMFPAGQYEINSTISLPHLQESLINSRTNETRCLNQQQATGMFPILKHPSFSNCHLIKHVPIDKSSTTGQTMAPDHYRFKLQCKNVQAATGTAIFNIEKVRFTARLDIKMGAKNMTMTQNLSATRITSCQT